MLTLSLPLKIKNQICIMTQRIINIVDLSALQQEYETVVDFANDLLPNVFATTPQHVLANSHTETKYYVTVQ